MSPRLIRPSGPSTQSWGSSWMSSSIPPFSPGTPPSPPGLLALNTCDLSLVSLWSPATCNISCKVIVVGVVLLGLCVHGAGGGGGGTCVLTNPSSHTLSAVVVSLSGVV
eukprot:7913480-Karenia_brevis.AAC.1